MTVQWGDLRAGDRVRFRAFPDVLEVFRVEGGRVWLWAVALF